MAQSFSVDPTPDNPAQYASPESPHLSDLDDDDGQLINERRAQAENAEALRLARAI